MKSTIFPDREIASLFFSLSGQGTDSIDPPSWRPTAYLSLSPPVFSPKRLPVFLWFGPSGGCFDRHLEGATLIFFSICFPLSLIIVEFMKWCLPWAPSTCSFPGVPWENFAEFAFRSPFSRLLAIFCDRRICNSSVVSLGGRLTHFGDIIWTVCG